MSEGFAAIPNWMIRDENVSLYALTVYGALASHSGPGGIHPSQGTIAREARCSDRQVRRALVELEELGVVSRVRRKNKQGRAPSGYVLHPNGNLSVDEEAEEVPDSQSGTSVVPDSQSAGSGLSAQITPLIEEQPENKNPSISPQVRFEEFWSVYPRRVAKKKALEVFVRVVRTTDPQLVLDGARRYAAETAGTDVKYIAHPTSWLNQERWTDEPAASQQRPSTIDHGRTVDELLRAREQGSQRLAVTA
ncbi:helix-turn-helix domain-containing protein [Microbacterium sp. QXD-8]|uniref:Helix-turn-helix domain-containing protein n=1 Tax=Microbacterium psychrotolerans TaxID=3068321 RepID=A0ABU0YYD6_9MICO|nr:helix-turn-helix domain-containing protein [Microbacterium sp. QXD-8]MDQ7877344.1 helix-turn-helix domain-containing protein [Microbacterium sp. QXD-8]